MACPAGWLAHACSPSEAGCLPGGLLRSPAPRRCCLFAARITPPPSLTPAAGAPPAAQVKEEGWWLVAGDTATGDLLAIKRVSFGQRTTTRCAAGWERGGGGVVECVCAARLLHG